VGTGFSGENCEIDPVSAAAEASAAESEQATTRAIAATAAVVLLMLLSIGGWKYRQHLLALKPVDFQQLFDGMLASGVISPEHIEGIVKRLGIESIGVSGGDYHLPREIPRRCITKSEKLGEGAFGEVFKGKVAPF
jgi:hypothetical protein